MSALPLNPLVRDLDRDGQGEHEWLLRTAKCACRVRLDVRHAHGHACGGIAHRYLEADETLDERDGYRDTAVAVESVPGGFEPLDRDTIESMVSPVPLGGTSRRGWP